MAESLYGPEQENKAIWVFIEQHGGTIQNVAIELLGKGRQLADEAGWPLVGLMIGYHVKALAQEAIAYGADQALLIDHLCLEDFCVETYASAVYEAIMQHKPSVLLLGATAGGRDLAGRLAVRLRTGLNADCTNLRLRHENGILVCEVSGYGGGVLALIEMERHRPQMATVRPGVFPAAQADHARSGRVVEMSLDLSKPVSHARLIKRVAGEQIDLTTSPVLVAGGRGVDGNFAMLHQLAELLDGEVGATRPPVDEGHIGRERQIGQTGIVCRPDVAIVCGASGAFHFVVGIEEAEVIIAINSDPDAPIFDYADYVVVGDVQQVVPALIHALQQQEGKKTLEAAGVSYG